MESICQPIGTVILPPYSDTRIMMMPFVIGEDLPEFIAHWDDTLKALVSTVPEHKGAVGYLTIDERFIRQGHTHRRPGLHVDGVYRGREGAWGGGGGPWASQSNGMILVASEPGCVVYNQRFKGRPGPEGECDHMKGQLQRSARLMLRPETAYWMNATCVHESLPMRSDVRRQLMRLSLPSTAPWFEGYTESPLGVQPTGPILPRRDTFMDWNQPAA